MKFFARLLGGHVLLCEPSVVREVRREDPLQRHDVSAETARMEMLALAVPVIAPERDSVRAVFAAERDLEAPETDAFGLFGVALRLLDLGDEARVHDVLHTPNSICGRQTCRVLTRLVSVETLWKSGRFPAGCA